MGLELGRYIGKYRILSPISDISYRIVSRNEISVCFRYIGKYRHSAALEKIGKIRFNSCLKVTITFKNWRTFTITHYSLRFPKFCWVHSIQCSLKTWRTKNKLKLVKLKHKIGRKWANSWQSSLKKLVRICETVTYVKNSSFCYRRCNQCRCGEASAYAPQAPAEGSAVGHREAFFHVSAGCIEIHLI